jgi:hypothetical protein
MGIRGNKMLYKISKKTAGIGIVLMNIFTKVNFISTHSSYLMVRQEVANY